MANIYSPPPEKPVTHEVPVKKSIKQDGNLKPLPIQASLPKPNIDNRPSNRSIFDYFPI